MLVVCGINLFLAAMILVALPYLVTEVLDLEASQANRLYGYAEGALAAGGLAGGICAGIFIFPALTAITRETTPENNTTAYSAPLQTSNLCDMCVSHGSCTETAVLRSGKLCLSY